MRTACGAILISSVGGFADVEQCDAASVCAGKDGAMVPSFSNGERDDLYLLLDRSSGEPLQNTEYAIVREGGAIEFGRTDSSGRTHLLSTAAQAEAVKIYVEG